MITYLCHSSSTANDSGCRAGWADPPLSALGEKQARELSQSLRHINPASVYTSDLLRARQTAAIVFPGKTVFADRRLREMNYGVFNNLPGSQFPGTEEEFIVQAYEAGESCIAVESRMRAFLADCYTPHQHIVLVSHRFPQLALEVIFNQLSWSEALAQDWRHQGAWQPGWTYT